MLRANLFAVKMMRICLLVLLAVLLPVRGAVAAAMLCPIGETGTRTEVNLDGQAIGHHHHAAAGHHDAGDQHPLADAPSAPHGHDAGHHPDATSSGVDKCNLCAAFCSVTSMVSSSPTVLLPRVVSAVRFPALSAPPSTFVSGGQERPPRRI